MTGWKRSTTRCNPLNRRTTLLFIGVEAIYLSKVAYYGLIACRPVDCRCKSTIAYHFGFDSHFTH